MTNRDKPQPTTAWPPQISRQLPTLSKPAMPKPTAAAIKDALIVGCSFFIFFVLIVGTALYFF